MKAYIYWVTNDHMTYAKIGYHTGSLKKLYNRYISSFGRYMTFIVFQMEPLNIRQTENKIHCELKEFHYTGELFWKECYHDFLEETTNLSLLFVDRVPFHPIRSHIKEFKELWDVIGDIRLLFKDPEPNVHLLEWGLNHIDLDFKQKIGSCTNQGIQSLMKFVFEDPPASHGFKPSEFQLQHRLIREVMSVLGWDHPFDTKKEAYSNQVNDKLIQTQFFIKFNDNIGFFSSEAKAPKNWTQQTITSSLKLLFKYIECDVVSRQQPQQRVGKKRQRHYVYYLDEPKAEQAASLLNLRTKFSIQAKDSGVQVYLSKIRFGSFSSYTALGS